MSNAIFAPNFKPNFKDDLYVYGFWDYLPPNGTTVDGEGIFVPAGMVFVNEPKVNNELVGIPNSVILKWTGKQYDNYIKNIFPKDLARILWNNAKKSEEPSGEMQGKNLYTYTFNSITFPDTLTAGYDLAESKAEATNILLNDLADIISDPRLDFGAMARDDIRLLGLSLEPLFVSADEVVFDPNNLLLTMCRYLTFNDLYDCKSALDFEIDYLSNGVSTPNNFTNQLDIKGRQSYRLPDQISALKPNCQLCSKYAVYCSPHIGLEGMGPEIGFLRKYLDEDKGLYLAPAIDLDPLITQDEDTKLFNTLEDAKKYFFETLANTNSKWICLLADADMGPDPNKKCVEILEPCAIKFANDINENNENNEDIDIILYDTRAECEENCNKLWYCIEYECVKINKDDPSVAELQGYLTQEECENTCEIPTQTPS